MLSVAQRKLKLNSCSRVLLLEGDALKLPFPPETFDVVTIAFGLRNLPDVEAGLAEMTRILKPKGRLLILEFSLPTSLLFRRLYLLYLKHLVPLLGGLITGDRAAYDYLHRSILEFPSTDEILRQLRACGLSRVRCSLFTGGIAALYWGKRL
jgi:demethylmenaquinone methyltransferase/2-methoxy-6-polyprenyl-1,4-benzoquinol methylase